ncbi:hypothetical protein ACJJTC_011249 [Scirpophaga incertulas]
MFVPLPRCRRPPGAPAALPADFQEALDIIFPGAAEGKQDISQELYNMTAQLPSFPVPLPFPSLGLVPQMPPQMFGFEMNPSIFSPRPQLYDAHVPLVPQVPQNPPRPQNKRPQLKVPDKRFNVGNTRNTQTNNNKNLNQQKPKIESITKTEPGTNFDSMIKLEQTQTELLMNDNVKNENGSVAMKKEQMDELAMLGIDASDVGAM